jgi:hypothetical protein
MSGDRKDRAEGKAMIGGGYGEIEKSKAGSTK